MKRSIKVFHLPSLRAERFRRERRRAYLQDGVIVIRCVKVLPPSAPPEPGQCVECGLPCEPGFFLHNECLKPIHARYFKEGA